MTGPRWSPPFVGFIIAYHGEAHKGAGWRRWNGRERGPPICRGTSTPLERRGTVASQPGPYFFEEIGERTPRGFGVCEFLGVQPEGKKIITCHIGNGGSVSAIKDGKCMDTSMGLTPLEGLMMGTRSGDIDAGAVTFIMDKENLDANGVSNLLNKKSGVMGIFGESSDMRDLENAVAAGNPRAILAEKMYFYRIKKYVGAYAAALGGVDIIVFTGGVGENQCNCRSEVCEGLGFMGVKVDLEKNKVRGEEAVISTDDSKVKVVVIPTDEELMIASDTMAILSK